MLNIKVALVFPELVNWDAKEQKQNIEVQFYKVYVNEKILYCRRFHLLSYFGHNTTFTVITTDQS